MGAPGEDRMILFFDTGGIDTMKRSTVRWNRQDIDKNIVGLVDEFNKIEGIQTLSSCEGHTGDEQPQIMFRAEDHDALKSFMARMEWSYRPTFYIVPHIVAPFTVDITCIANTTDEGEAEVFFSFIMNCYDLPWRLFCLEYIEKRFRHLREKYGVGTINLDLDLLHNELNYGLGRFSGSEIHQKTQCELREFVEKLDQVTLLNIIEDQEIFEDEVIGFTIKQDELLELVDDENGLEK